ncbi:hypothetical protein CE91St41_28830 [Oscillospiraceae bacterium]|nr:hypothetical protein CE91St40_28830 [Oscillospiraceae bacterium]BDF75994.1 hypothetical protein CE91St41_28830 [Oscillospiraceae bacterium]
MPSTAAPRIRNAPAVRGPGRAVGRASPRLRWYSSTAAAHRKTDSSAPEAVRHTPSQARKDILNCPAPTAGP